MQAVILRNYKPNSYTKILMKKNILVTGSHNSGTTWTGYVLCSGREIAYILEPFNPINEKLYPNPIKYQFHYVTTKEEDIFKKYIEFCNRFNIKFLFNLLKNSPLNNYHALIKNNLGKLAFSRKLVKDPSALFAAPYFYNNLGYDILFTIRHPAAFAESIKRRNWMHNFHDFLNQKELMNDILYPYEKELLDLIADNNRNKDIIEHAIMLWNLIHFRVLQYKEQYPNWIFVTHENLSLQPMEEFKNIFSKFDLDFNEQVKEYIKKTTSTSKESKANRDPYENIKKWTKRLSKDEIERIYIGTKDIAQKFYTKKDWFGTV